MSEPHHELTACYSFPDTYNLEFDPDSTNEILQMYTTEILQGCAFSEVDSCLVEYVTSIIEPVGWKAVWRPKQSNHFYSQFNYVVEVVNVSLQKLEADISVKSVVLGNNSKYTLNDLKKKINFDDVITVPLIELYTICEDDEDEIYVKSATAIDYVRFFMTHLSRPWDGENEEFVYSEKVLKPRLQLYFDIKSNVLPKRMISKIKCILKQGWSLLNEMQNLYSEMNASDSEAEIGEDDVLQAMSLRAKLNELQAKMEILENPVIRSFMMKKYVPCKSAAQTHEKSGPVTYVVSKQFTYQMIANLPVDSSTVLEFEHSAETAFKVCSSGDKIIIFPGVYECDTLGWLDGEITVEGIGQRSDIVLEATGNSDVFLNCISPYLCLTNVCLKAKKGLLSALVVHHGEVHLKNCLIDSNEASLGILLLGGSIALLEDSTVCNSSEDGIQMRCLSSLCLTSSDINHCQRHGIQIDVETTNSTESFTELTIIKSFITDNEGHGIHLNNVPLSHVSLQKPSGDFSVLNLFHWLKSKIEDSDIESNKESSIGFSSMCQINNKEPSDTKQTISNSFNQEDLNCSAISDFLNEISFTDLNASKYDQTD